MIQLREIDPPYVTAEIFAIVNSKNDLEHVKSECASNNEIIIPGYRSMRSLQALSC